MKQREPRRPARLLPPKTLRGFLENLDTANFPLPSSGAGSQKRFRMSNGNYVAAIDLAHCFGIVDSELRLTQPFEALRSREQAHEADILSLQLTIFMRQRVGEEWRDFEKSAAIHRLEKFLAQLPSPAPSKTKLPRPPVPGTALYDYVTGILDGQHPPRKSVSRQKVPQSQTSWSLTRETLSGEYLLNLTVRVPTEEAGKQLHEKLSKFLASHNTRVEHQPTGS